VSLNVQQLPHRTTPARAAAQQEPPARHLLFRSGVKNALTSAELSSTAFFVILTAHIVDLVDDQRRPAGELP
jgi:hypothetical protein